nr:MAG TPA: hypothetical protein [Caudoviricetes sp.]
MHKVPEWIYRPNCGPESRGQDARKQGAGLS